MAENSNSKNGLISNTVSLGIITVLLSLVAFLGVRVMDNAQQRIDSSERITVQIKDSLSSMETKIVSIGNNVSTLSDNVEKLEKRLDTRLSDFDDKLENKLSSVDTKIEKEVRSLEENYVRDRRRVVQIDEQVDKLDRKVDRVQTRQETLSRQLESFDEVLNDFDYQLRRLDMQMRGIQNPSYQPYNNPPPRSEKPNRN